MKVAAVIVCAGFGRRLGQPKASFLLGRKPLFYYSLKVFLAIPRIKQVILVLQKKHFEFAQRFISSKKVFLAQGAASRSRSVANGLDKIKDELDYVLIHDCARPFLKKRLALSIIENLKKHPAVVPAQRVSDTLKEVKNQKVERTLRQGNIFSIQTPQGFKKDLIQRVYKAKKKIKAADSAQLVEAAGQKVKVVEADPFNFKITYPQDIRWARKLWKITE